ncbi:MAG: riboflavin synthase subunit alpha, partial [Paenibacillus sp. RIFOXYA1_FULL_44_5]
MFTGIIEEIGKIKQIQRQGQAMLITISAQKVLTDVKLGDSIAVNGVCLTVVHYLANEFSVDVMPETFRLTGLRHLSSGSPVNLERAMQMNGRFGGHIVQGHVDAVGTIRSREIEENAVYFRIEPEKPEILKYVIAHGSITLDGISLTVVETDETSLSVSIIPHTLAQTVLQVKKPGDQVNMECDVLAKYVEKLLLPKSETT